MVTSLRKMLVTKIMICTIIFTMPYATLSAAHQKKEPSSPGILDTLSFPKALQDIVKAYAGIAAVPLKKPLKQNIMHEEYYVTDNGEVTTEKPSAGAPHEQILMKPDDEPGSYQILDAEKKYSALIKHPTALSNTFRVSVKSPANGKEALSFTTTSPRHDDIPIAFFAARPSTHYFITGEYQKNRITIGARALSATPQKDTLPEILYIIDNVVAPTKVNGFNSPQGRYLLVLNDTTPLMLKITDPISAAEELSSGS